MPRQFVDEDEGDVTIEGVRAERATDLALLCVWKRGKANVEKWVPKSVITDDSEVWEPGHAGKLVIARWFAEKEGLE